ncbi:hypothetical protein [Actinoplanes derwentensis]|uniref:Uncharacterized protein n=1 Tax=Actinoplanes derwentensis TaxID=113562 RepID=A0A1H2AVI2_9ACTN|nr:hypothetical protein [Actinoplanes derwentensis]GID84282.1 hypothetical protein Ade03nite_32060 [Actinoplanes derwentensis]SDT49921.1 hypothetical protein SAMN04489716_4126 [Actinoplanes derwentensis]
MESSGADRRVEGLRAELRDMPVYTLATASPPAEGRFGGMETFDATVTVVHLVYEAPTSDGPWADVETARWTGLRIGPASLRTALEHQVRLGGDRFSELTWTESPATLLIDGYSVDARRLRAGDRWWAVWGERDGIEITVVGRDWHPDTLAVEVLPDPTAALGRTRPDPPPRSSRPVTALSADSDGEPHRALADAVLRNTAAQAAWQADGGPVPELPAHWSALWQAAVRRQMDLSDQPEPRAAEAVRDMTSQLADLFHEFAWFRTDDDLRRRAVSEILLFGTGLAPDVPSAFAQQAWQLPAWRTAWQAWAVRA